LFLPAVVYPPPPFSVFIAEPRTNFIPGPVKQTPVAVIAGLALIPVTMFVVTIIVS